MKNGLSLIVDCGLGFDVPMAVDESGCAGCVGDNAFAAMRCLYVVPCACRGDVHSWHHEGKLLHFGVVNHHKCAVGAVGGGENKDGVAVLKRGCGTRKDAVGIGLGQI